MLTRTFNPQEHKIAVNYEGLMFYFVDLYDCAKTLFNFHIKKEKNTSGEYSWILYENNKKQGRSWHYRTDKYDSNGFTYDEAVRDYLSDFIIKHTYKNLHFFHLVQTQ